MPRRSDLLVGHGVITPRQLDDAFASGRVSLYELLMINGSIREMVLKKCSAHEIWSHALKAVNLYGLQEDGIAKALLGRPHWSRSSATPRASASSDRLTTSCRLRTGVGAACGQHSPVAEQRGGVSHPRGNEARGRAPLAGRRRISLPTLGSRAVKYTSPLNTA